MGPEYTARRPAVAGSFYPSHPVQLRTAVERFLVRTLPPVRPTALLVPHAGYLYSGSTAGKTYAASSLPERILILCPNHTGLGSPLSLYPGRAWLTPLGECPVDAELNGLLLSEVRGLEPEERAHLQEHAVEVQIPFLQVYVPGVRVSAVAVGIHDLHVLRSLGEGIARALARLDDPAAIVVSTDMNHYEDARTNRDKDDLALDAVRSIDAEGLHRAVLAHDISMCGFAPAVAALTAARLLGANAADVVDYTHSGMVTGDEDQVVSYAGVRIFREAA
ncbi:MAG: AmmeMemoRadiSam system protein B [Acidobacteriota bacterium]